MVFCIPSFFCYTDSVMNKHDTIIFIGRSGSGKGTQVNLLQEHLRENYPQVPLFYFESGGKFRELVKGDGYINTLTRNIMSEGKLVPDIVTDWLFVDNIIKNLDKEKLLILDGFPRTPHQVQTLGSALEYFKKQRCYIIHVEVSEGEVRKRMVDRGRSDDLDMSLINTRIHWYNENVLPTLEILKSDPVYTVFNVNGEQSADQVHKDIINLLTV